MIKINKRLTCLLVAVASTTMLLSGCGGNKDAGAGSGSGEKKLASEQIFKINLSEPTTIDPAHYRDDNTGMLVASINEPLIRDSKDEKGWEPGLATDFKASDDFLKYTFNLRKDAKWEDGTPITAKDVEYSYKRIVDPATASRKAFDFYFIKNGEAVNKGKMSVDEYGVKAIDDYTVEITLEKPLDYFVELMKTPSFGVVQKAAVEANKDLYGTGTGKLVASGPFKLKDWQHDSKVILEKNENYWDAANVTLNTIEVSMIKDGNTTVGKFKTGDLDFMDVSPDFKAEFEGKPEYVSMPRASVQFIEFNPNKAYLNNLNIRQALSMTINRDVYVNNILKNGSKPAYGLVPFGIKGKDGGDFREQAGNVIHDISEKPEYGEEAKKLLDKGLQEIGKTKEDMTKELTMHCIDNAGAKRLAQAIQQMWKENLGVEVSLIPLQTKMLMPILEGQTFDIVVGGGRVAPVNDPADFIDFVYNEGKWDNKEFKDLIEKSREAVGDERMDYLMKAEKVLLDNAVFIPQNFSGQNFITQPGIDGLRVYPANTRLDFKYIKVYDVK